MRSRNFLPGLTILLAFAAMARAADAPAGAGGDIAPFINGQTLLVIRADVDKVDFKTVRASVDRAMKTAEAPEDIKADLPGALDDLQANGQRGRCQ